MENGTFSSLHNDHQRRTAPLWRDRRKDSHSAKNEQHKRYHPLLLILAFHPSSFAHSLAFSFPHEGIPHADTCIFTCTSKHLENRHRTQIADGHVHSAHDRGTIVHSHVDTRNSQFSVGVVICDIVTVESMDNSASVESATFSLSPGSHVWRDGNVGVQHHGVFVGRFVLRDQVIFWDVSQPESVVNSTEVPGGFKVTRTPLSDFWEAKSQTLSGIVASKTVLSVYVRAYQNRARSNF